MITVLLSLLDLFWQRLLSALSTFPDLEAWLFTLLLLSIYGTLALIVGLANRFLHRTATPSYSLQIVLRALLTPALIEEIGFRVLLLPHPSEVYPPRIWWIWGVLSLLLFVLYHPCNALLWFKSGYPTFLRPTFLILAAGLGCVCTLAYGGTGSLWPPVLIHWIVVSIWLCRLGGYERLQRSRML